MSAIDLAAIGSSFRQIGPPLKRDSNFSDEKIAPNQAHFNELILNSNGLYNFELVKIKILNVITTICNTK